MADDADLPLEHVYVPPDSPVEGPDPAAVVLHGRGADERDLLPVAQQLPDHLAVVSLRAPDPQGPGYTWFAFDRAGGDIAAAEPEAASFSRCLDVADEAVTAAVDRFELDPDRLGLLGFSQGAIASTALLVDAPDQYAWVAALHGYLPASHLDRDVTIDGTPAFLGGGSADPLVPAARVETTADRLEDYGADVTVRIYQSGHGIHQAELEDLVEFVGSVSGDRR
jgi:phospholipase/carboxylesterase